MSESDGSRSATTYVVAILAVTGLSLATPVGLAGPAIGADADPTAIAPDEPTGLEGYSAVQGDRCVPLEPLGNENRSVESFYDYRNPATEPSSYAYSSFGTTHLQENDTSALFLYEGADGLALVVLHDRLEGGSDGGAVTMEFDGLPAEGEWVVEDDNYSVDDGPEITSNADATWEHGEDWTRVTWVWSENRTDGGAFTGGLDDEFELRVTPAFDDEADYRVFDGEVTDWQLLSGSESSPERTSLEMTDPIELRSSPCTAITDVAVDDVETVGESATVVATVANEGEREETTTVPFAVDGDRVDEREVTLEAGERRNVSTTIELDEPGTVPVSVGGETATVSVPEEKAVAIDRTPSFGVVVAAVALGGLLVVSVGRRRV